MGTPSFTLVLSDEQITRAKTAFATLEEVFVDLISLEGGARRRMVNMGVKSEVFARQAVRTMDQNPKIVPPMLDVQGTQQRLDTIDVLRPMFEQLGQLHERADDTIAALGAEVMEVALGGYAILKVAGKSQGLDSMRKSLSKRFDRRLADDVTGKEGGEAASNTSNA